MVDPQTNEPFGRPVGTDGDDDGPAPEDDSSTSSSSSTTTTSGRGQIPANATYSIDISTNCPDASTAVLVSASLANGTLTFTGGGDSIGGPINPDGSFSIPVPEFPEIVIVGDLDADGLTATIDLVDCTATLTGTRNG